MTRFRRSLVSMAVLIVVAGVLVLDAVVAPPSPPTGPQMPITAVDRPSAGAFVCSVGFGGLASVVDIDDVDGIEEAAPAQDDGADGEPADADDLDAATLVTARAAPTGAGPAAVVVEEFGPQDAATERFEVFPGADVRSELSDEDEPAAAWVQWFDAPVAVSREWRIETEEVSATLAGGCAETSARRFVIPGMSTTDGADARLRLANPYDAAASVAVRFLTPTGTEEPTILQNISVPARSVREIAVNETLPEREDLSAIVEVRAGRLAVEGSLLIGGSGVAGPAATLLEAFPVDHRHGERASEWTVPWIAGGDERSSWLWMVNLGEETASVELSLHTADGAVPPQGLAQVSVPPEAMRRVELAGTFPEGLDAVAVTARTELGGLVVSSASALTGEDPAQGMAIQLARPADTRWAVSGGFAEQRTEQLRIANPGVGPAVVDVTLFNGVAVLRPEELQEIEVPAGSIRTRVIDEAVDGSDRWSAFVQTTEGSVVVGRVGHRVGAQASHLTAVPGTSANAWVVEGSGLAPLRVEGLTQRLGTDAMVAPPVRDLEP